MKKIIFSSTVVHNTFIKHLRSCFFFRQDFGYLRNLAILSSKKSKLCLLFRSNVNTHQEASQMSLDF